MTEMDTDKTEFLETLLEFGVIREQDAQGDKGSLRILPEARIAFPGLSDDSRPAEIGGCPDDGPLMAALLVLFSALREGSLCVDLHENGLQSALKSFLEKSDAEKTAKNFLSGIATGKYGELIATDPSEYLPLILSGKRIKSGSIFKNILFMKIS